MTLILTIALLGPTALACAFMGVRITIDTWIGGQ